jgi:hypothetical protein
VPLDVVCNVIVAMRERGRDAFAATCAADADAADSNTKAAPASADAASPATPVATRRGVRFDVSDDDSDDDADDASSDDSDDDDSTSDDDGADGRFRRPRGRASGESSGSTSSDDDTDDDSEADDPTVASLAARRQSLLGAPLPPVKPPSDPCLGFGAIARAVLNDSETTLLADPTKYLKAAKHRHDEKIVHDAKLLKPRDFMKVPSRDGETFDYIPMRARKLEPLTKSKSTSVDERFLRSHAEELLAADDNTRAALLLLDQLDAASGAERDRVKLVITHLLTTADAHLRVAIDGIGDKRASARGVTASLDTTPAAERLIAEIADERARADAGKNLIDSIKALTAASRAAASGRRQDGSTSKKKKKGATTKTKKPTPTAATKATGAAAAATPTPSKASPGTTPRSSTSRAEDDGFTEVSYKKKAKTGAPTTASSGQKK